MTKHKLIGLYAPTAQSGKSVVAGALVREGYELVKFAGPLKAMMWTLLEQLGARPCHKQSYLEGDFKETSFDDLGGKSPRYLMQTLGTEWGRDLIHPDFWCQTAMKVVRRYLETADVVIDDLRFPNEFDAIKAAGGEVWKITRPGFEPSGNHPSEGLLCNRFFDRSIINGGTMDDLVAKIIPHV